MTEEKNTDATNFQLTPDRRSVLRASGALLAGLGAGTKLGAANPPQQPTGSPRPGPDVLYEPPVTAPQFETVGSWQADPLRVCGADAYVGGEYLYQDYIYDDHGANTTPGLTDPQPAKTGQTINGPATGDVVYPTDEERFRYNAADLLEFRAAPRGNRVDYRITLNTLTEAGDAAVAIGIDTGSGGRTSWEYGIGEIGAPIEYLLVTWGTDAALVGPDGETTAVDTSVDLRRNQLTVELPLDPGRESWRHYVGVGLWDEANERFRSIQDEPTPEQPGGAHGDDPVPLFNVGFRFDEPTGNVNVQLDTPQREVEQTLNNVGSRGLGYGHWREHRQAKALGERDISEFGVDIDFARLRDRVTERRVPEHGYINRLYSSRERLPDGLKADGPVLTGRVQPYTLYIPESYDGSAAPLHVELHGRGATYNQTGVYTPDYLRQIAEQRDALLLAVEGRGPSLFYKGLAELDVFEAWNDVRNAYATDDDRVTMGGYSMGGIGTFTLACHYPDLLAKGFSVVGAAFDQTERLLDNLRHVPMLMWNASNDELVPASDYVPTERRIRELGYRHELDVFLGYDHFLFGARDQWGPGRDFLEGEYLGSATVERNPSRVTYRRIPALDEPDLGLVHDGAYWVTDISVTDEAEEGRVDAISYAEGYASPITDDYRGPSTEPDPHLKRGTRWVDTLDDGRERNALDLDLDAVSSLTVYLDEAQLDAETPLQLRTAATTEATVTLVADGRRREVSVSAGTNEQIIRF